MGCPTDLQTNFIPPIAEMLTAPFPKWSSHLAPSLGPLQPHHVHNLRARAARATQVEILVQDPLNHTVPAILHDPHSTLARGAPCAVILVSGAGGGVSGPGGIYPSLATKLASLFNLPILRLDYRRPAQNRYCVSDVYAAMDFISHATRYPGINKFVLVGWSFGSAPILTVASGPRRRQVIGVASIAGQTAQTDGVDSIAPTPVLIMHGTEDTVLSPSCSETLYQRYGGSGQRTLKLFEGDNHALTNNSDEVERLLLEFILGCAGIVPDAQKEVAMGENLTGNVEDEIQTMREGHDLENGERLE